MEVFTELSDRSRSAGAAYPFKLDGSVLRLRSSLEDFPVYVFCLCISSLRFKQRKGATFFPRRVFEQLASVALSNYVEGESVRFGSPRTELPGPFKNAIAQLSMRLGEGEGYRHQQTPIGQDRTLDVVAWKPFVDELPGKLIVFGQCASGADWEQKLSELQPIAFCQQWLINTPVVAPLKAFFVPHRVPIVRWQWVSRLGGVVFDRCRLSFWAQKRRQKVKACPEIARWCNAVLKRHKSKA